MICQKLEKDGLGKYTISNAEYCLIARKGNYWREARNVQQIVEYPKTEHSEKPKEIRDRISVLMWRFAKSRIICKRFM